jgi:hypothetical protein
MRRASRWAFNAATLLSLLLCIATCVVWARSRSAGRFFFWTGSRTELQCAASQGELWVYWAKEPPVVSTKRDLGIRVLSYSSAGKPREWGYGPRNLPYLFDWGGFAWGSGPYATVPGRMVKLLILPCWTTALFTLALPAWWMYAAIKAYKHGARLRVGHCPICGYDLRATPGRCPECGTAPNAVKGRA